MKKCEYCGSMVGVMEVRELDVWRDLCLECRGELIV